MNKKATTTPAEQKKLKLLAAALLSMNPDALNKALDSGTIMEVPVEDDTSSKKTNVEKRSKTKGEES